jgi:hypothetical protein
MWYAAPARLEILRILRRSAGGSGCMKKVVLAGCVAALLLAAGAWLALVKAQSGDWAFSRTEDGIQALFLRDPAAADQAPLLRLVCNEEDGVISINSQALTGDAVEKRAERRHQLDLALRSDGHDLVLEGYPSLVPEGSSVSWEVARSGQFLSILSASDLTISGPGFKIGRHAGSALLEFVRACPAVVRAGRDSVAWESRTSLENGYRIEIPRGLFRVVQGDRSGRLYRSEGGNATLVVMGGPDAMQQGLEAAIKAGTAGLPALDRVTYRAIGRRSAVVSGYAGDSIVYYKARATCDGANIAYFVLTYDAALRETFDPIVTHMSRSFDATSLPGGKPLCP